MNDLFEFFSVAYRFTPIHWLDRLFGVTRQGAAAFRKDSDERTRQDFQVSKIRVTATSGVCGAQVEAALKPYDIPVSGRGFMAGNKEAGIPKSLFFYVPAKRADWVKYLLASAGYIVLNDPDAAGEARAASGRGMPTPWRLGAYAGKKDGPIDRIIDALWR